MKLKIILIFVSLWFLNSGISAGEAPGQISTDKDTMVYILPEIVVKGDDSLHSLRMDVIRAEELKYEIFNNLNSTDEFDITCTWHAPLGSRIKRWGCNVGYMEDAETEDAREWVHALTSSYGGIWLTAQARSVQLAWKTKALNKEMTALAADHPELAIAMVRADVLQQLYEAEAGRRHRKKRRAGDSEPFKNGVILNEIVILSAAFQDHGRGVMPDEIWKRWDGMCKKIFGLKSYQVLWKSANHDNYPDEFVAYVNRIISTKW